MREIDALSKREVLVLQAVAVGVLSPTASCRSRIKSNRMASDVKLSRSCGFSRFPEMFLEQVRVKPASKSSAGKTLSRADVPEEEWKKFGLAPPIPEVRTNKSFLCPAVGSNAIKLGRGSSSKVYRYWASG